MPRGTPKPAPEFVEGEVTTELRTIASAPVEVTQRAEVQAVMERRGMIVEAMHKTLVDKIHFGKIPGCGPKPSLFLPGAEMLASMFKLAPRYQINTIRDGAHREFEVVCELDHNGEFVGSGVATCSTWESKYRYRGGAGEDTGRMVPRGYWDMKKTDPRKAQELLGGAGFMTKKNEQGNWSIFTMVEKAENPDLADQWNTCKKMACKRAFVHAVRTATGTADLFTQDIEDFDWKGAYSHEVETDQPEPAAPAPAPAPRASKPAPAPAPAPAPVVQQQEEDPFGEPLSPEPEAAAPGFQFPEGFFIPAVVTTRPTGVKNDRESELATSTFTLMAEYAFRAGYTQQQVQRWVGNHFKTLGGMEFQDWLNGAQEALEKMAAAAVKREGGE